MDEEMVKYLSVYVVSMLKFIGGPIVGFAVGLSFLEIILISTIGMMTTVIILSYFGLHIRTWLLKKRKKKVTLFTKRNRRLVFIWRKYGEFGLSFITPIVLSPIVGTLLVTALGGRRGRVIIYMFLSAVFWSFTISSILTLVPNIVK